MVRIKRCPKLIFTLTVLALGLLSSSLAQLPGDQVWLYPTGAAVTATPSLDPNGNILIGSEDTLAYAVTPSRDLQWVKNTGDYVTGDMAVSPLGYTVFGSWDGFVYAVNHDGTTRWTYNAQAFITGSPAVSVNGMTYIGARDGIFYALRPDGNVEWFHIGNGPIHGGAAIGSDGTVYYGDESGTLFALNPDGSLKWKFAADIITDRNARIRTTPTIDRDGTIYFGSGNHYFYALYPDGTVKWKYQTADKNDSSAAIDSQGHIIFASRDGYLYKLAPASGVPVWARLIGDVFYCSPAVDTAGNIYIAGFIGSGITRLYALDADSNELWSRNFSSLNDSSPLLTRDGHLYIGFHDGFLYKIYTGHGPANSPWPMKARNASRTANMDEVFATAERIDQWLGSDWFGWLKEEALPWYYHAEHQWIYGPSLDAANYWYYDVSLGKWLWTTKNFYPYMYLSGHGWVYYFRQTIAPNRWFFSYTVNNWFEEPALKTALQAGL